MSGGTQVVLAGLDKFWYCCPVNAGGYDAGGETAGGYDRGGYEFGGYAVGGYNMGGYTVELAAGRA
jgi:hypothetical protein